MAIIKCKMCGGDLDLIAGQSVAECEFCGTRQTVPSADNEKKLTLFARANRLRVACEFDKAAGIYESIVADFPEEAEAYWGLVLCKYGIEYVDDPATGKKIPTCHRSSFDSVMDDSNFEQAMENADEIALRVYREEAKQIEGIRKGILEVSSNEQPYDIFICYKETDVNGDRTVDSLLAQDIYDALSAKGYRVFFSRITLEDKLGQAYEPYIFAALNSAKIMLAVGTCYEHYNAVWVKNEWSRYLKIIAQDKNKYLIPCYKGIDAYDIPKEFAHLQGQDMGKVGAIQDLLRGVEKILPKQKPMTVVQERVVVGGSGNNKIASLLDRGNMALEDGDWAKADSFFEDVLNNDSKNAQAYLGKTLAQERCRTIDAFARKRKDASQNVRGEKLELQPNLSHVDEMVEQFSLLGYVEQNTIRKLYEFDLSYHSDVAERKQQYRTEENYWANHKQLSRAEKFAVGAVAENLAREKQALFAVLADRVKKAEAAEVAAKKDVQARYEAHLRKADEQAEKLYNDGIACREKYYQELLQIAKASSNVAELTETAEKFEKLGSYQDSKNLAEHCRKRAAEEQAKIDAEAEHQRIAKEKQEQARKAKNKKITVISAAVVAVMIAAVVIITQVIIPNNNYNRAVALMNNSQYEGAIVAFEALDGYKDSVKQIELCEAAIQKAEQEATIARLNAEYDAAIALMNAGKHEEAMAAFKTMDGYKDSAEMVTACETTIKDAKYDAAMALMNAGKYEEAAAAFEAIAGHRDSTDQAQESKYRQALALIELTSYTEAYDLLTALNGYKDTADYLANYCYLPVYARCASNSATKDFYITYDQNGKMTGGYRDAFNEKNPVYSFDEKGVLVREEWSTGTDYDFKYHSDGTVEKIPEESICVKYYDRYGNMTGYISMSGEHMDYTLTYDEYHNESSKYAQNTYDENGNLVYVYYRMNNYICESVIEYELFYLTDVDEELAWKNFRMICGDDIW